MDFGYKKLKGYKIRAKDGDAGKLKDIMFDEQSMNVRYFVIDTGKWLPGRKVLLTPLMIEKIDDVTESIHFDLAKVKIENSPTLETQLPVSRQYEQNLYSYYGWAPYWTTPYLGSGWFPYPDYVLPNGALMGHGHPAHWAEIYEARKDSFDQNLRSAEEICGYGISSGDDKEFGEVSDLIFTTDSWSLLDLILSSRKWLPGGKEFTCSPLFVTEIDEVGHKLKASLTKETLMNTPEYSSDTYGEESRKAVVKYYVDTLSSAVANASVNDFRSSYPVEQGQRPL